MDRIRCISRTSLNDNDDRAIAGDSAGPLDDRA